MITRRRGRAMNTETKSLEVEVVELDELTGSSEKFPVDGFDTAGIELEDLFGIEDLTWTPERDPASPLFDLELTDLGVYAANDQDSGVEVSTASSPERMTSGLKISTKQNQSNHVNKNAIAARLNRLKKKEYVTSLEKTVGVLSTENSALKQENTQLTKRVEELENETRGPTQTTMTMPYRGSVLKWRRKRHPVVCVCMWTRTMSRWSSALNVQRVQAHH